MVVVAQRRPAQRPGQQCVRLGAVLGGFVLVIALAIGTTRPNEATAAPLGADWPGDNFPLPMTVKTQADLAFKREAERQYLIFNLLAAGRLAYEKSDYGQAIAKWSALLALPHLEEALVLAVNPLLAVARANLGRASEGATSSTGGGHTGLQDRPQESTSARGLEHAVERGVTVAGVVDVKDNKSPAGVVVWLDRLDGPTPRPKTGFRRTMRQVGKAFLPHILVVPVGATVNFRNDDTVYHDVFSLSKGTNFDTGLYESGKSYSQRFDRPGPVDLLCNIHANMSGYVFVVDSAYYAQTKSDGGFSIGGVLPGRYEVNAWQEAADPVRQVLEVVAGEPVRPLSISINPNHRARRPVDKYGRPRQLQLGY